MKKISYPVLPLIIICFFLLLPGCTQPPTLPLIPGVANGMIDLRGIDLTSVGPVHLAGNWEFYWQQLLRPEDFLSRQKPAAYLDFPGAWNIQPAGSRRYPVFGYATLRLKILCDLQDEVLALFMGDVSTACTIFAGKERVFTKGRVAGTAAACIVDFRPDVFYFQADDEEVILTIQIANYSDRLAGITDLRLGSAGTVSRYRNLKIALELFLFGCFLVMGLYHFILFLFKRTDTSTLYFSAFSLMIGLRTILMGQRLLYLAFPETSFSFFMILEFLTIPLSVICLINFFNKLYGFSWFKYVNLTILIASGLLCLCIFFTPLIFYSQMLFGYLFLAVGALCIVVYGLIKAVINRREGVRIFLAGFSALFATVINDILVYQGLLRTGYLLPFGFLSLVISQSLILIRHFTSTFISVEKMSRQLVSLDKLKDAFLANTTHELRTPLHGIIGLSDTLLSGTAGKITKHQAKIISLIEVSARRLSNLVNDILDFSRLKREQLVLKKSAVDLHEICNIVFLFSQPLIGSKKLKLRNAIPEDFPLAEGDLNRIQQIMHNLIGNAIKFTHTGEVTVTAVKKGNQIFISVQDTGIGIAADQLETIFESFEQLNKTTQEVFGGTGLGLPVSRQLVELHGGTITVESQPGSGSVFTFSLPLSSQQKKTEEETLLIPRLLEISDLEPVEAATITKTEPAVSLDGTSGSPEQLRILAVDDELVHLRVLREMLSGEKFKLRLAANGLDALEIMQKDEFDIILLDVMMPGMSGYLVCKEIRRTHSMQELPVLMLTARNFISGMVEGLQSGANDYLAKPISRAELLARIDMHMRLARINAAYSRFVPDEFLRLLGKESFIGIRPGDHVLRTMTILFCDIRSFMTLSEKLTPRQNFQFLNSYYEKITPVIKKNNGFIDKFIGDEIMALFPDNPENALQAALEIKHTVEVYNSFRIKTGYDPISIGIGIHSGPMILGTIGDNSRMEGTVISDAVNVAARLEGLTKLYGGTIILSSSIFHSLSNPGNYLFRFLGLVQVKGKHESVHIYEFFDENDDGLIKKNTKDTFERSLQKYYTKNFTAAEAGFSEILNINPADKAARLYLTRCREYLEQGIREDWDGVESVGKK